MLLANKSLITIDDFSVSEIEGVFDLADSMAASLKDQLETCRGKVMASLFFEPSTRTRLSFETAMHRLGGSVVSAVDIGSTSLAKGESIADMARVIGSYADIIVIRHPWEGAAKVVADYSGVPVINAGDGGHQHPTQTLCDLYTIRKQRQTIRGLNIALWGDLKYGRTTHSLIFALAKFGANILFCPSPGLEVPDHVISKLVAEYGGEVSRYRSKSFPLNAIYTTPNQPHQLAMMPDVDIDMELRGKVDALYVTRPQKERFASSERGKEENHYPVVDKKVMKSETFRKSLVMHPLPRVDELAYELDTDPRSMYFKQAAQGVPVRMALLAVLLGDRQITSDTEHGAGQIYYHGYRKDTGLTCPNARCVSVQPTEVRYLKPEFKIVNFAPLTLRCVYCEHGFEPAFVASTEWHHGMADGKKYHRADSHLVKLIKPENLVIFNSASEAQAHGFKPSRYAASALIKEPA